MSETKATAKPARKIDRTAVRTCANAAYNKRKPPKVTLPSVRSAHQGD